MEPTKVIQVDTVKDDLLEVQELLAKHRLVGEMARRQESPRKRWWTIWFNASISPSFGTCWLAFPRYPLP